MVADEMQPKLASRSVVGWAPRDMRITAPQANRRDRMSIRNAIEFEIGEMEALKSDGGESPARNGVATVLPDQVAVSCHVRAT